ncbi:hypothetical protein S245_063575, partial [Arachis hypogaea]
SNEEVGPLSPLFFSITTGLLASIAAAASHAFDTTRTRSQCTVLPKIYVYLFSLSVGTFDGIPGIFYNLRGAESLAARWFAERFLHHDIVYIYDYAFLWDEDLGVEHFSPSRLYSSENEDSLKALKEKEKELSTPEPEPEPTTEVLFLCSYEGCRKTFIDAGALRKYSHIHGERQFICHYEGCVKLKALKLKRHFLIHTGERDFVCPHEGCGKVGEAIPLSDASVDAVVGTLVLCFVKDIDLALK